MTRANLNKLVIDDQDVVKKRRLSRHSGVSQFHDEYSCDGMAVVLGSFNDAIGISKKEHKVSEKSFLDFDRYRVNGNNG